MLALEDGLPSGGRLRTRPTASSILTMDVGDNTLDLSFYLWERIYPMPHNVRPEAIVVGVDHREEA
jgi:hypothetical protein